MAEDTQAYEVAGEFEDPQDSNKSDDAEEAQDILGSFGGESAETHLQVEGQDGHEVDDVESTLEELQLVRAEGDPQQDLDGEPDDAHALHVRKPAVSHHLVHDLLVGDVAHGDVFCFVDDGVESLMRLHAESGDGDEDEE